MKDIQMSYENEKRLKQITKLDSEKRERDIKLGNQRKLIIFTLCALIIFLIMTAVLYRQKTQLKQAYLNLFHRNKETISVQQDYEIREKILLDRISDMETQIGEYNNRHDNSNDTPQENGIQSKRETRPQSVDKLSAEKKNDIFSAIESVIMNEDYICNPEFSVEMLADITGYNSRYVSHIINEKYGCNFRTLLNNRRMDIARKRIIDVDNYGNLTIQAISTSLGYKSHSGFIQLFRKYTGVTPSMFQKMARNESK